MKKIDILKTVADIFDFKTVTDKNGNEYVLYANSSIENADFDIGDKTQFESVENHVHLVDNVKKSDFNDLIEIGKVLGKTQLNALKAKYSHKEFYVFVTVDVGESMIIRFHQVWKNEPAYYNPDDFDDENTKILMFVK